LFLSYQQQKTKKILKQRKGIIVLHSAIPAVSAIFSKKKYSSGRKGWI
jgi:hypothetical protein